MNFENRVSAHRKCEENLTSHTKVGRTWSHCLTPVGFLQRKSVPELFVNHQSPITMGDDPDTMSSSRSLQTLDNASHTVFSTSDSSSNDDELEDLFSPSQKALFVEFMAEQYFKQLPVGGVTKDNAGTSTHTAYSGTSVGGSTGGQPTGESRKRKFPDTNDKGEDGDGEKDMPSGRHDNDGNDDNGPLMACPYYKWRPLTHKNCQSKVLKEISKLKLHLWRCHDIPVHCPICFDQFPVERDRDAHVRNQSCHLRDRPSWGGITLEQKVKIKKRADPRRSRVEHWFVIFRILFPGNPLPSSAFVEVLLCNELATLRNFISQSWRPTYDSRAEEQLPDHLRQHVSAIQQFSHAVFEDTVALLLDQFQSASQSEASGSGRAGAPSS